MIDFHPPQPEDKPWVDALLAQADYRGCDYNFTSMFVWQKAFCQTIAQLDGFLVSHLCGKKGASYLYPAGSGDMVKAITQLEADALQRQEPFRLVCLTPRHVEELEQLMPGHFSFEADRDGFDYLYATDRLADLPGKKLHAKRNHINRFVDQNPDWVYEEINQDNLSACMEMDQAWNRMNMVDADETTEAEIRAEVVAIRSAMANFQALQLEGGLLRVEGEVVAFTIGDRLSSDTYNIHFEKAYAEMQGAYAMINRAFARWIREKHPEISYLNREDDMGIEGLRRAKASYYPDLMVEKYTATAI